MCIISLASQSLISIADFSWVLHHAPEAGTLPAIIRHGDAKKPLNLVLPAEWRTKTDIPGQRHCAPRQPTRRALLAHAIKAGNSNQMWARHNVRAFRSTMVSSYFLAC